MEIPRLRDRAAGAAHRRVVHDRGSLFGLGVLLVRGFLRRGLIFLAALSFPLYLATYEYLVAITSPHSTFGDLGLHADELSARNPDRVDHGNLGNQFHCLSVCDHDRSSFERRR